MKQKIIRIDLKGVNTYLLKSKNGYILVDAGGPLVLDKGTVDRGTLLEKALEKEGCSPHNLHLIILTHGDLDHAFYAPRIKNKYNTKIAIHKNDSYLVNKPTINDFMNSFKYRSFIYKIVFRLMNSKIYETGIKQLGDFETFSPDILIDDNFHLSDFGVQGEVLHIPGHTLGSIGILTKDNHLISGDVFANIKKPEIASNAHDFKLLSCSVDKLKKIKINKVYPGHGEPFMFDGYCK